jgi:hypothetical protein
MAFALNSLWRKGNAPDDLSQVGAELIGCGAHTNHIRALLR